MAVTSVSISHSRLLLQEVLYFDAHFDMSLGGEHGGKASLVVSSKGKGLLPWRYFLSP